MLISLLAAAAVALTPDTDGNHINAHGGCIMQRGDTFYWYGEHRSPSGQLGVTCYSSTDLENWDNLGLVLEVSDTVEPLRGGIIERPKVVRNPWSGKYVMWYHRELPGRGYGAAEAAVAVADSPAGPFRQISSGRVNPGILPLGGDTLRLPDDKNLEGWTPEWREAVGRGMYTLRDIEGGQMARDQTIFIDADSTAWHIYSSEENLTLQIARLDSTYTRHTGEYVRVAPAGHNEAPVLFSHGGRYWMITSGCTGWAPNAARLFVADTMTGPWIQLPNPCRGEGADKTFGSQGCYAYTRPDGTIVFMADIWTPDDLRNSRHLAIPVRFDPDGTPYLRQ